MITGRIPDSGTTNLNFNGTLVKANQDNANFITVSGGLDSGFNPNVTGTGENQGARFDTNGYNIGIGVAMAGSGKLTKSGTGTLTLSGANTYSGGTAVNTGVLSYAKVAAKPSTGTTTVVSGATLGLGVKASDAAYFSSTDVDNLFSGTLAGVTNDALSNVGIDTSAGNFTYATSVASTTRGLVKLGANTLNLTAASSYTGGTVVNGGTLSLNYEPGGVGNTAIGAMTSSNTVTINNGGILTSGGS